MVGISLIRNREGGSQKEFANIITRYISRQLFDYAATRVCPLILSRELKKTPEARMCDRLPPVSIPNNYMR